MLWSALRSSLTTTITNGLYVGWVKYTPVQPEQLWKTLCLRLSLKHFIIACGETITLIYKWLKLNVLFRTCFIPKTDSFDTVFNLHSFGWGTVAGIKMLQSKRFTTHKQLPYFLKQCPQETIRLVMFQVQLFLSQFFFSRVALHRALYLNFS